VIEAFCFCLTRNVGCRCRLHAAPAAFRIPLR
jgi:hypothetical protein